jgi:pilus assembly protein FimV
MYSKRAVFTVMLWLMVSTRVFALGLGGIEVESTLNDPFRAVVQLTSATDEELKNLKVSIASREAFNRVGLAMPNILSGFTFSIDRTGAGRPVIRISGKDAVREPFLEFLLEASWPRGRLVRQYTVLIDPPYTMPTTPVAPAMPVTPVPRAEPVKTEPVAQTRPASTRPVPTPTSVPVPPIQTRQADHYGPVKRNDTLWLIAKQLRPDSDVSMNQMMLALLRANPGAFADNNINNLKAGSVLRVPDRDEIMALSRSEAHSVTSRQHSEWKQAQQPEPAGTTVTESEVEATPAAETRLQLMAPADDVVDGDVASGEQQPGSKEGTESNSILQQQLAQATEEVDAGRAQNIELISRLTAMEEQVDRMQRLLELKDDELARMQDTLAAEDAGADPDAQAGAGETAALETVADEPGIEDNVTEEVIEAAASAPTVVEEPNGLIDRLMDNPVLSALGVLVAMVLGGFLWASTRQRKHADMFADEPTLASQLAAALDDRKAPNPAVTVSDPAMHADLAEDDAGSLQDDVESDPLTEADVLVAYGRIQQAEDVIQNALKKSPEDKDLKLKLLEVYHAAGNGAAFDTHAEGFHRSVGDDDPLWLKVAVMGYELSPANQFYKAGAGNREGQDNGVDFDMDLSGMDDVDQASGNVPSIEGEVPGLNFGAGRMAANPAPESIEFILEDAGDTAVAVAEEEVDEAEGLLSTIDEVGTKLDLARAFMDMGDPDGARSILEEVLEEGSEEQKREAGSLFSQIN